MRGQLAAFLIRNLHIMRRSIPLLALFFFVSALTIFCTLRWKFTEMNENTPGPWTPKEYEGVLISRILWSPSTNPHIETIMKTFASETGLTLVPMPNSNELANGLHKILITNSAGIQFDDSLAGNVPLGPEINVYFRLVKLLKGDFSKLYGELMQGEEGAYHERFIYLQEKISNAILRFHNVALPNIKVQELPQPHYFKSFGDLAIVIYPLLFCSSVAGVYIAITLSIIRERNCQIRESLEMSGVSIVMLWGTWFITGVVLVFLLSFIVTLLVYFIPSLEKHYIINNTSVSVIFFLNLFFGAALTSLAILTSTVIKKEEYCAIFTIFILVVSAMPVFSYNGPLMKLFIFCPPTAYVIGLYNIFHKESYRSGYNWTNLNHVATYYLNVRLYMVFVALFLETIIYLIIAVYLDAVMVYSVGYPKRWNFCCKANFWRRHRELNSEDEVEQSQKNPLPTGKSFQPDPKLPVAIKALGLTKQFDKKIVVDNVTFNIYENQITVLIGHNGAGKSTTVNMMTGTLRPTSGTALVNGYDIRHERKLARRGMGFCPQQNLFFDELSVSEQLLFFARVRGSNFLEARKEIEFLCTTAKLDKSLHTSLKNLSGGSKRKVSMLSALCGNTKLVILDEPTSGVDPVNRKSIWGILRTLKQDRTILLITHHMDEADSLGDRIILLNGGKLQSIGSGAFLKKEYEIGYRISIEKGPNGNDQAINRFMKENNGELYRISGNDLIYDVPMGSVGGTVRSLENKQESLDIISIGVSRTPLDELFIEYVVEKHDENTTQLNRSEFERSKPSLRRQFLALMYKKVICSIRDGYALIQILVVLILYLVPVFYTVINKYVQSNMLHFTLSDYYDVIALTEGSDKPYWKEYKEIVEEHGGVVEVVDGKKLEVEALNKAKQDFDYFQNRYVVGASFGSPIVAYYNTFEDHSLPLTYSVVVNAILRKEKGKQYKIQMYTYPVEHALLNFREIDLQCIHSLSFAFGIAGALPILFYSEERRSKSMHLQIISGANVVLYWLTALLWEMVIVLICALIAACISNSLGLFGFTKYGGFNRALVIFFVGGLHITCFIFLVSHIQWRPEYMVSTFIIILIGLGFLTWGIRVLLADELRDPTPFLNFLYRVLISLPMFNMLQSYLQVIDTNNDLNFCKLVGGCAGSEMTEECVEAACMGSIKCCNFKEEYYDWDYPGIGKLVAYAICLSIIFFSLTVLIDSGVLMYFLRTERHCVPPSRIEDEDVLNEKKKIKGLSRSEVKDNFQIALANVTKMYCKMGNLCHCKLCTQIAVRNAYVGIENNECFALLGLNGAGKTTTFEIITGEIAANSGMIYVDGYNIRNHTNKVQRSIGYCPQADVVIGQFTGRENLVYFLILRGYSKKSAEIMAEALARKHGFYSHIDKRVHVYSGGNKRKLSLAIALLGESAILALDEPTSGVDPGSRRHMFSLIMEEAHGKTTLLTTHHLEDCEAMCTRAVIMANGKFKCIGSLQHLKAKYAAGYNISIKLTLDKKGNPPTDQQLKSLKDFIASNFTEAALMEELYLSLSYKVSNKDTPWSRAFGVMEDVRKNFPVEDFSIEQCGLDDVFLKVAEKKRR